MEFLFSPLEQFSIFQTYTIFFQLKLLDIYFISVIDLSITVFLIENFGNMVFFIIFAGFLSRVAKDCALKPLPLFLFIQTFLYNIVSQQIVDKSIWDRYFILLSTLFYFIFLNNILGMIPYGFVSTAQLGQNFLLSSSLIIFFTFLGFYWLEEDFLDLFVPSAPAYMIPFLVIIELISYISRAFSLAIRLFANLMSGHTLLFILCAFNSIILNVNFFGFIAATTIILLIFGLELVIAFMQAYVFLVLASVYLKDSTVHAAH